MDNTNIMVEFRILSDDLNPKVITEKLLIEPNQYWMKGENIKNRDLKREYSCWIISTGYEESLDINSQLFKMLNLLKSKKKDLQYLRDKYSLEYRFDIVINIENNEKPAIFLNSEVIGFANDIKAEFDFDIYIY